MSLNTNTVIPDAPKARSGIQMRTLRLPLDSGFAHKSVIADLCTSLPISGKPEIGARAPE